ncbi:hypothetical protein VHARVF571_180160 [Vibrio harveyi]|nr:hypothetical protein VHARVF571_180160 [Vibrio harveyi]
MMSFYEPSQYELKKLLHILVRARLSYSLFSALNNSIQLHYLSNKLSNWN